VNKDEYKTVPYDDIKSTT